MQNKKRGELKAGVFIFVSILILVLTVTTVSAERLPIINGDNNGWGTILNSYLSKLAGANATELNTTMVNGTNIYSSTINTTHLLDGTIIDADISNTTNLTLGEKITFTLGEIIDNIVDGWITIIGGLNVTNNLEVNGGVTFNGGNFSVNNSDLFVNINNGRVGIGTNNPSGKLNIIGNGNFTGNITSDWATFSNLNVTGTSYLGSMNLAGGNITATLGEFTTLNVTGTSYLGDITITADNITTNGIVSKNGNISFYNNVGSEKVRITNTGNVGIGTNAPSQLLEVSGGDAKISVTGSSGGAAIYLKETLVTTTWAEWQKTDTSLRMNINDGATTLVDSVTILNAGNVGIGDSTPDVKLEVGGQIRAKGDTPTNGGGYAFTSPGDVDGGMFSTADGTLQFYTNNVERVRIDSSGRVGIGTASTGIDLAIGDSDTGFDWVSDGVLSIYTNNVERMKIDASGNINISGNLYTDEWQDYSVYSTSTGFSAITFKAILYKKIGKIVYVNYHISGTSNSGVLSFTLPYSNSNIAYSDVDAFGNGVDNGVQLSTPSTVNLPSNSNLVTITKSMSGAIWTSSGTKSIKGQFWYEAQ